MNWVKRKDELPKEEELILIRAIYSGLNTGLQREEIDIIPYSQGKFELEENINRACGVLDWTITHWLKIPKIPED